MTPVAGTFGRAVLLRARRVGPGPLIVRAGLFSAGLVAEAMAWPFEVTFKPTGLLLALAAALPAAAPDSRRVTVFLLTAVFGWLLATTTYGEPVAYWRLVFLAAGLYSVHTLAALAAVLPIDARVSAGALVHWLLRAAVVVALTVVVALFTLVVPESLGGHRYLLASLIGLLGMIGLAGYLASPVRRR